MSEVKVCIIGAGCSGITTAKRLKEPGSPTTASRCPTRSAATGTSSNPNGTSACYESLHIDTSKWRLAFEDFPVPADWPDFPHHSQLLPVLQGLRRPLRPAGDDHVQHRRSPSRAARRRRLGR